MSTSTVLFKKIKQEPPGVNIFMSEEQYNTAKEQQPDMFCFVAEVKTPRQVTEHVRSDPLAKWVLFRGDMVELSVSIPVFVDGRNIETPNEWF